jgi:glucuronate isomerase
MKKFMDENFLLSNDTAVRFFHNYSKDMPIIDFHCHLNSKEIYENKKFKNITEAWLYGDHYKWRVMRAYGIDEKYITGDADDYEKFMAWAKVMPATIGNPLYHWTHLELQRFFGVYEILNEKTAPAIWEKVNGLIKSEDFSVKNLIKKSKVESLCTTDDPADSLEYHIKLKEDKEFGVKVLPAFRPDKALNINKSDLKQWIVNLGQVVGKQINDYNGLLEALEARAEFFHSVGCRISDHGLDYIPYLEASKEEVAGIFAKAVGGEKISNEEEEKYKTYTLKFLGGIYSRLDWAMQLHVNALRNNNTRMFEKLGPDTGYDSVNDRHIAYQLSRFLDSLEINNTLPKTILYTLNPKDNYVMATIMGSFHGSCVKGKLQLGAAWWFADTRDGMIEQMRTLANVGLLSCFVGMLTDSRSFLSYTRHEYFRRILCNMIGEWVENGEVPEDMDLLGGMVKDISYYNAKEYFGI